MQTQLPEPDVDQRATGTRDVPASLVVRADPVPDLPDDPEGVREEPRSADEITTVPQAPTIEPPRLGGHGLEPAPFVLDRLRVADERHPFSEASAFDFDRLP